MADFVLSSLRGGLNEDPPISLRDDQCVTATNVEWVKSKLGERRNGAIQIDVAGSDLEDCDRIVWVHRHTPTDDLADAQLWALGITDGTPDTATLAYKDTSWHTVSVSDAFTLDGVSEYQVQGQSLHGKLFIAYNSAVDRLHVWDGSALRRCGLAAPGAAPTASDTGSGSFTGTRYYRTRETVQSGGVTTLRSEPSAVLTKSPSGSGSGLSVTKPTTANSDPAATHWELEASTDNTNFYVIATTAIGTSSVTDSTAYATGYAASYDLSEDVGDYTVLPSAKYLSADEDRLVLGGSWEDDDLSSRVAWTPVYNADGVGNDERLESDTDPYVDCDNFDGGGLTGLSRGVNGYFYATKQSQVWQITRTRVRTRAYEHICLTKQRGAIAGSLIDAFDRAGRPLLFALDPDIGPYVIGGEAELQPCGRDLIETWETVNLDATVVARGIYFPEKLQAHWWIATSTSETPDTRIVLHTNLMTLTEEGFRGGWAKWTGNSAAALTVCLFSTNIDDDTDRSLALVPFIGVSGDGLIWRTDTGTDDNGTAFAASMKSRPLTHGNLLHEFESQEGMLLAKTATGASMDVVIHATTADVGLQTKTVSGVSFTAGASETGGRVIRRLDELGIAEANTLQIEFKDVANPSARWQIEQFALKEVQGHQR